MVRSNISFVINKSRNVRKIYIYIIYITVVWCFGLDIQHNNFYKHLTRLFRLYTHLFCRGKMLAARCAAVLFVAFCWLCASDTPQFVPSRWLAALRYPIFPQAQRDGVFFVALRAPLFPRPLCGRIFRNDSRSRHTPVYPTSKLAALSPPPRPPLIF